ncbi:MAG: translation initiation factor IF-2 subunit beta [Marine Group III euryarchaeote CG-Epi2]|uniref:Translation initiation factor 2 subunit beta n=1 Tax=Marine Group III euryarchaeote CG-Epi2 TaxID=1888996 RepID=A0A1J5TKU3_9ARCH|nr:MAG: translation initiation factor IF-2 subunit beta [Marine Group III euryarchaeote CG-Epi2]
MDLDYDKLLERAREGLEDVMQNAERFSPPVPDIMHEGSKKTIIRNFSEIVDSLRRDETHLYKFLLQELGTAGSVNNRRLVLQGRVPEKKIKERIKSYIETFVVCQECNRPDTSFLRTGRTLNLHCEACGAKRPIRTNLIA